GRTPRAGRRDALLRRTGRDGDRRRARRDDAHRAARLGQGPRLAARATRGAAGMTPRGSGAQERWLRLSALYDEAAAQPRTSWAAFLETRCPDDAAMRDELMRMLEAAVTWGPLDAPPHPLPAASAPIVDRLEAALKGRYRVIEEVAQGGMGAVYRAHELKHRR